MSRRGYTVFLFLLTLLLLFSGPVIASEKYSYHKAEELTPLIEWRDYNSQAFLEAQEEHKPIFLLLTAPSWCYWCQVYESEDYNLILVHHIAKVTCFLKVDLELFPTRFQK